MATVEDAETIARQRLLMFEESGQATMEEMAGVGPGFVEWVRPRLADGTYEGWPVEDGGRVVAGAGIWWMDFPPHFLDAGGMRAYLLNFYVVPEERGKGLAVGLLRATVEAVRVRGVKVVVLHASKLGRPIYARNGFEDTNEMRLLL